jgi:hypothetical protein
MGWVVSIMLWSHFTPIKVNQVPTHWIGGWVGRRAGLDTADRAEVGNLFLNVAIGVANEKLNSPHHVKTKKLGCSTKNFKNIKIHCLYKIFQHMWILTIQLQLPLDANNEKTWFNQKKKQHFMQNLTILLSDKLQKCWLNIWTQCKLV